LRRGEDAVKKTREFKNYIPQKRQTELKAWCDEAWPKLYRYIYFHVQNREEAEDLTQETFTRLLANSSVSESIPSLGYLRTIALNLIRDRWRHQQVAGVQVPLREEQLFLDFEPVELKALVEGLMAQLSVEHRTVLQLRIIEGYSRAETARMMERSEDAIRGLQYRALQVLRGLMLENLKEEKRK